LARLLEPGTERRTRPGLAGMRCSRAERRSAVHDLAGAVLVGEPRRCPDLARPRPGPVADAARERRPKPRPLRVVELDRVVVLTQQRLQRALLGVVGDVLTGDAA